MTISTETKTYRASLELLSEVDGVEYFLSQGSNGPVLVHIGKDGYSRETPITDFRVYFYQRTGFPEIQNQNHERTKP